MSEHDDNHETEYTLVMPYVACKSNGGEFDDNAFVAGVMCGRLMEQLPIMKRVGASFPQYVPPELIPQIDLIAMQSQYSLVLGEKDETGSWQHVTFMPSFLVEEHD